MIKKTAFIGHRDCLPEDIEARLKKAIKNEIDLGCNFFTMGTHGCFDKKALYVCKSLKEIYKDIEIEVVITSFNQIKPEIEEDKYIYKEYSDVKTIMYNIEETYFKSQIIESNKQMIDTCETLICFIRPNKRRSGAKTVMNYAKKRGLKIINLYKPEDDFFM